MRTRFFRPRLEPLDDRRLPSLTPGGTYPLNNDGGPNSLGLGMEMAVGDFDGDGHADLAVETTDGASGYGSIPDLMYTAVEVLRGRGDGSFDPARVVYVTDQFVGGGLVAGDVNGDGRSDLVIGGYGDPVWLLGNADGSFTTADGYPAPELPAAPDMNGDGYADSVWIAYPPPLIPGWSGQLAVSLRRPDGTSSPASYFDTGWAIAATVGDFNEDGRPDVAVASRVKTVTAWLNDGDWPPADAPAISIGDAAATEGNTGARAVTFTVTLSAASSQPVTVAYATAGGTAAAGSDYQAASGTLTIPAGQTTGRTTVLVTGDRQPEPNETFLVNLINPNYGVLTDGQGVGTIVDDEPRISIGTVSKKEGKKNQTTLFTFTVSLSAAYDQPVTMSYRTVDGTATTGDGDYVAKTGTLTFAPGETTKTITVEVKGDSKKEADEYFFLELFGNSSNSLFTGNRGLGTILNDD
jgi:hypothetical protein